MDSTNTIELHVAPSRNLPINGTFIHVLFGFFFRRKTVVFLHLCHHTRTVSRINTKLGTILDNSGLGLVQEMHHEGSKTPDFLLILIKLTGFLGFHIDTPTARYTPPPSEALLDSCIT